jgi:hypothetical protein
MKTLVSIFLLTLSLKLSAQQYSLALSSPQNLDTLMNVRPSFIWNATGINERTSFSIKVCKVSENQNIADALILNSPVVQQGPLDLTLLNFPYMEEDLDSSSQYIWQVTMYDSGLPVFVSEVYSFYTPFPPIYKGIFWVLEPKNLHKVFTNNHLAISYNNRFNQGEIKVEVINFNTSEVEFSGLVPIVAGLNNINLSDLNGFPFLTNGQYEVSVITDKQDNYDFTFLKN